MDGVSNRTIKLLDTPHRILLTSCFNHLFRYNVLPPHWQTAKIILLSKANSTTVDPNDTRPISLLPSFAKIYEKLFLTHFRTWITENNILPEEQSGFRPGHNMGTRIVGIVDQIGRSLTVNTATAALFIDFKAAFKQLWFKDLWLKLFRLNCPPNLIVWIRRYLVGRSAFIEIKGEKSKPFDLHRGVPQGSCVGPVLFTVFHHDLLNTVSNLHHKHLYADDLAIVFASSATWSSGALVPTLVRLITEALDNLSKYASDWKQPINYRKTNWTLFHRRVAASTPTIHCENQVIEHVPRVKYLGVWLDAQLSLNHHISTTKVKINKNLSVFKRLQGKRMPTSKTARCLYNAFIRPHNHSFLSVYPILSSSNKRQIEALHRKVVRTIHGWHDASNDEITCAPLFVSIEHASHLYFAKLLPTIVRTNPQVIVDFLEHKQYLLYLNEYYTNPRLKKEKRGIAGRGRTPKRLLKVISSSPTSTCPRPALLDLVLCFPPSLEKSPTQRSKRNTTLSGPTNAVPRNGFLAHSLQGSKGRRSSMPSGLFSVSLSQKYLLLSPSIEFDQ